MLPEDNRRTYMRHIIRGEIWWPYISAAVLGLFLGLLVSSFFAPRGAELVWLFWTSAGVSLTGGLAWTLIWLTELWG